MFVVPAGRCFPFESDERRKNSQLYNGMGSDVEMIDEQEMKLRDEANSEIPKKSDQKHDATDYVVVGNGATEEFISRNNNHNDSAVPSHPENPCNSGSVLSSIQVHSTDKSNKDSSLGIHDSWMSKVLFIDICHRTIKLVIYIILRLLIVAILVWPIYHFYNDWKVAKQAETYLRETCYIDYEECVGQVKRDIESSGRRLTPYDLERCRFYKDCIEKPLTGGFQLIFINLASTLSSSVDSLSRNTLLVIGGFFGLSTAAMFSLSPFSWITAWMPAAPLAFITKPLSWLW